MMSYRKLVRSSAIYDLILTGAFAFPVIASFKLDLLRTLHVAANFSGSFPGFDPMHLFFVHLTGSVVVIWSLLRILNPQPLFGFYDGLCRVLFSIAMANALFLHNGTGLIWFFLVPEILWAVIQLNGFSRLQKEKSLQGWFIATEM